MRPSRRIRWRDSSSAASPPPGGSARSSFTATVRLSSSSVARHTAPMAPAPIRSSMRYRLPTRVGVSSGELIARQRSDQV